MYTVIKYIAVAIILTIYNVYIFEKGVPFSYKNFNALMLVQDGWYLHYFNVLFLPLISLIVSIHMCINVYAGTWLRSDSFTSNLYKVFFKIIYIYIALNLFLTFLLSVYALFIFVTF
jgi:hypothetical protein